MGTHRILPCGRKQRHGPPPTPQGPFLGLQVAYGDAGVALARPLALFTTGIAALQITKATSTTASADLSRNDSQYASSGVRLLPYTFVCIYMT